MIQTEVIKRVFWISFAGCITDIFTFEQYNIQFLIAATHIFKDVKWPDTATINVDIKYPKDSRIDIVVLKTNPYQVLTPFMGNSFSNRRTNLRKDICFFGKPYNYDRSFSKFYRK